MRQYTVVMCALLLAFIFADQNLMAPNLTAIGDDFDMDEEEKVWNRLLSFTHLL